jgi:hypothetical protein
MVTYISVMCNLVYFIYNENAMESSFVVVHYIQDKFKKTLMKSC